MKNLNLGKDALSQQLFARLVSINSPASQNFKRAMSKTSARRLVDIIFGVAARYSKEDCQYYRSAIVGTKINSKENDGIIASHLLETQPTGRGRYKVFPKVVIPNFGTFTVAHRRRRTGKHPVTQKRIDIPETHVVTFRAGTALKSGASILYK